METKYITTDLDLEAPEQLDSLVHLIPDTMTPHYFGPSDDAFKAVIGLLVNDIDEDQAIAIYCDFLESIARSNSDLLSMCTSIKFNFGYEAGSSPSTWRSNVSWDSINRVAGIGGELEITIYQHAKSADA